MMMPSRGIVSATRQATRTNARFISATAPARNMSSVSRMPFRLVHRQATLRSGRTAAISALPFAAYSRRLASTSSTPPGASVAANPGQTPTPGPLDDAVADAVPSSASAFDISGISDSYLNGIPEQIGYLKEIGLDYGWGPTAMIEYALEHIHVYSGLPWWGSIMATAVAFRLVLLPMFKRSSDMGARQAALQPVLKPLNDKMRAAMKASNTDDFTKLRAQIKMVNQRAGISMMAIATPAIVQGVFGFCAFRLMRAMANLPVPGLETGGILWFTDLTVADPYLALPAIMALSMHVVFRLGGESGAPMANPAMRPLMLWAMPTLVFVSTFWLPACLDLWLATTGLGGILQVQLFRQAAVRSALGMAPLIPTDPRAPHPHGSSPSSNTIDVKGTSRPAAPPSPSSSSSNATTGRMRYQAPNLRTTSPSSNRSAEQIVDELDNAAEHLQRDLITRTRESFYKNLNSIGDSFRAFREDTAAKAAAMSGNKMAKESKTRSKEFLKQAEAYERRWKAAQKASKEQQEADEQQQRRRRF